MNTVSSNPCTPAIQFHGQRIPPYISDLSLSPSRTMAKRADDGWSIVGQEEHSGGLLPHRWNPTGSLAFISTRVRESLDRRIALGQSWPFRRQPNNGGNLGTGDRGKVRPGTPTHRYWQGARLSALRRGERHSPPRSAFLRGD